MEACLNLLGKKCFHRLPFVGIFIFILTGAAILSTLLIKEPNESETFRCYISDEERASDNLRDRCYKEYDKRYNKNFPLYGFTLLNFLLVSLVCVVYSQYVRERVDQLDNEENVERSRNASSLRCKVFTAYVRHLQIRSFLMMVFLVLQWTVIYPRTFPAAFTCFDSTNSTENRTLTKTSNYSCKNPQSRIKTISGILLFAITALFLGISLVELIYLYCKEKANSKGFTTDWNFCKKYLSSQTSSRDAEDGVHREMSQLNEEELPVTRRTELRPQIEINVPLTDRTKKFQENLLEQIARNTEFINTPIPSNEGSKKWKLDEIFVNLVIQTGRKDEARYFKTENRDRILNAYAVPDKCTFEDPLKIFCPRKDSEDITDSPRTVLAVGRAGIGKSCLSLKILLEWAKTKTKQGGQVTEQTVGQRTEQVEQAKQATKGNDETEQATKTNEEIEQATKENEEAEQATKENDEAEQVTKETYEHVTWHIEQQAGQTTKKEQSGRAEQATERSKLMGQVEQTESAAKQAERNELKNEAFKRAEEAEQVKQTRKTEETVKLLEFAFLIEFRKLNKGRQISLKDLLRSSSFSVNLSDEEVLQHVLENPQNVLLIFDGLDEAKNIGQGIKEEEAFHNEDDLIMPVGALFAKLVRGTLLSGATVLTTTRSTALSDKEISDFYLKKVNPGELRRLEILGFTEDKVKAFVSRFASNGDMQRRIWNHIKVNANLLSLCYIPVNCFIVCYALQSYLERNQDTSDGQMPITLTEIYKRALECFISNHKHYSYQTDKQSRKESEDNRLEETLKSLGMLAKQGVDEKKVIFKRTDMIKGSAQISDEEVQELVASGLLHQLPNLDDESEEQYSFIHLTFQEFLAARVIADKSQDKLRAFTKSAIRNSNMGMVHRFVAGLLKDRGDSKCIEKLLEPFMRERIVTCMPYTVLADLRPDNRKFLLLLQCLLELQDKKRVEQVSGLMQIKEYTFSRIICDSDCRAVVFFFKCLNNTDLFLGNNFIGPRGCAELAGLVQDGKLTSLDIGNNNVGDEGVKHLRDALVKPTSKLKLLSVKSNGITALGAKHLKEALENENCQLTYLDISRNQLTDEGMEYIGEAVVNEKCQRLRVLDVSDVGMTSDGGMKLAHLLKGNKCTLHNLMCFRNNFGEKCGKEIYNVCKSRGVLAAI